MFGIGQTELVVVLVIVLLLFGPKNLPRLAQSIGRSVRELKNGLSGMGEDMKEAAEKRSAEAKPTGPVMPSADAQPVEHTEKQV